LPIGDIIRLFDLGSINRNNARFDEKKLQFFNSSYLHALNPEVFCGKGLVILRQAEWWSSEMDPDYALRVLRICQEKLRSFEELPNFVPYFFQEELVLEPNEAKKYLREPSFFDRIGEFKSAAETLESWTELDLENLVTRLAEANAVRSGNYIHAVRWAVSGRSVGPGFYAMLHVLGQERVLKRLRSAEAMGILA
jgi:glutamyl-tRNA synthetase